MIRILLERDRLLRAKTWEEALSMYRQGGFFLSDETNEEYMISASERAAALGVELRSTEASEFFLDLQSAGYVEILSSPTRKPN